jgi:hypothetical protein
MVIFHSYVSLPEVSIQKQNYVLYLQLYPHDIAIIILIGGDWNHGILNDFPFSWECHHQLIFFRGVAQPPTNQL